MDIFPDGVTLILTPQIQASAHGKKKYLENNRSDSPRVH